MKLTRHRLHLMGYILGRCGPKNPTPNEYPATSSHMLHWMLVDMEQDGLLASTEAPKDGANCRIFSVTHEGKIAFEASEFNTA